MNWADERFVKLYTRDTVTWTLLRWQGQTVLMHLLRKVDRSGIFSLSGETPTAAVSASTGLPEDVVDAGLERLFAKQVLESGDGCVVIRNFVEAQETPKSNALRCKEYRDNRRRSATRGNTPRAFSDTKNVATDTKSVATDIIRPSATELTRGDTTRLDETRLDETRESPPIPPSPGGGSSSKRKSKYADAVARLFAVWHKVFPERRGQSLTKDRSRILERQLRAGIPEGTIADAFRGASVDPWWLGQNDRNKPFTDIPNICGKGSTIEDLAAAWRNREQRSAPRQDTQQKQPVPPPIPLYVPPPDIPPEDRPTKAQMQEGLELIKRVCSRPEPGYAKRFQK